MVYLVRIDKGGYTYLYECRSHRVPGRKNPVSDRVYIGRVDRETREFIPKRYTVREELIVGEPFSPKELPRIPACYLPLREVREGIGTSSWDRG